METPRARTSPDRVSAEKIDIECDYEKIVSDRHLPLPPTPVVTLKRIFSGQAARGWYGTYAIYALLP